MKVTITLVLVLMVAPQAGLYAQEPMDLNALLQRGDVYLHPRTLQPYTGLAVGMWNSQTVRERGTLENGKWNGLHEWYHENGQLSVKETYGNGALDGPSESYFKHGRLSVMETYKDGELDGPYESYWSLGRLAEKGRWSAGEPCGDWISFGRFVAYPPCPVSND